MKIIWVIFGFLACSLALLGAFLPVLPTVPFLLVAAYCFNRGSKRFHRWLTGTAFYQKNLENYVNTKAMTMKTKIRILSISTSMVLMAALTCGNLYLQIGLMALIAFKYYYFFFRIKTASAIASKQ